MLRSLVVTAALAATACGSLELGAGDPFGALPEEDSGLPVLSQRWTQELADRDDEVKPQEFATPTLYDERLFVGSQEGTFYAMSAADGRIIWKQRIGSVSSQPTIERGRIYVGTDDGQMMALDTAEGRVVWRYETRGAILQPPVLVGDTLFFSNEADQVYALDRDTGKFRWQHRAETPEEYTLRGHAGVVVDGDLVFCGFSNGTVVALRANTGSVAWMTSVRGEAERFVDVDGTPVVRGDRVLVAASAGGAFSLDKTSGYVEWRTPIEGAGAIAADERRVYVAAAERGIHALDLRGNIIWRQGTRGGGEPAEPVVTGDYLVYTLSDAGMFIADKRTGQLHQFFDPGHGISARPEIVGEALYVVSNRANLYALWLRRF